MLVPGPLRTPGYPEFDVLTWRKVSMIPSIPEDRFTAVKHVDEFGEERSWEKAADARVDLLVGRRGEWVHMRQTSRIAAKTKGAGESIYRMGGHAGNRKTTFVTDLNASGAMPRVPPPMVMTPSSGWFQTRPRSSPREAMMPGKAHAGNSR